MNKIFSIFGIDWGKSAAVVGALVFIGLGAYPLAERVIAQSVVPESGKGEKSEKGGWAEKAMREGGQEKKAEVKAVGVLGERVFVGTKAGFFEIVSGRAKPVAGAPMGEVKTIVPMGGGLFLCGKEGISRFDGKNFQAVDWDLSAAVEKH